MRYSFPLLLVSALATGVAGCSVERPVATMGPTSMPEAKTVSNAQVLVAGQSIQGLVVEGTDEPSLFCVRVHAPGGPSNDDELLEPMQALESRPELRRRVLETPHAYFRWINPAFSSAVCRRFRGRLGAMPIVNLHGDAHLEQFVVTLHYAGLLDFDDSSLGPAVIDLVRFGVSASLAARQRGWHDQEESLLTEFLEAYRLGMRDPEASYPLPRYVERLRARCTANRPRFLERVGSLMETIDAMEAATSRRRLERYAEAMLARRPDLGASFFRIKALGGFHQGIGSALDRKVLVRVEGQSAAEDDDVVLEMKPLRDLKSVECVRAESGDASRVIVGHERLTTHRDPFLAIVPRGTDEGPAEAYWVQSWNEHYHELDVRSSLASASELHEIVRAAGVQLGRGHVNQTPHKGQQALAEAQERMLAVHEMAIRTAVSDLTRGISQTWETLPQRIERRPEEKSP